MKNTKFESLKTKQYQTTKIRNFKQVLNFSIRNLNLFRIAILAFSILTVLSISSFAVPQYINYQGVLRDAAGTLQTGTFNITFKIYDALTSGTKKFDSGTLSITTNGGIYNTEIGPLTASTFTGSALYLEVTVGSDVLSPRLKINSVGYAIMSGSAESATYAATAGSATSATSATTATTAGTCTGNSATATLATTASNSLALAGLSTRETNPNNGVKFIPVVGSSGLLDSTIVPSTGISTLSAAATNVTTNINSHAITDIFETGGVIVKNATTASACSGNSATATSATNATTATTATTGNALANTDAAGQSAITAINSATTGNISTAGRVSADAISAGTIGGSTSINTTGTITSSASAATPIITGLNASSGIGIFGRSNSGTGISAESTSGNALYVNGTANFNGKLKATTGEGFCVGTSTITAGTTNTPISNSAVTSDSLILLGIGNTNGTNSVEGIRISDITAPSFTVRTNSGAAAANNIPFYYLIIN